MRDNCFDVIVIGGGVLGCFALRSLTRYRLRVALLEQNSELCSGITKTNNAIIYAGYDCMPGTRKARMCVSSNRDLDRLCADLGVPFRRCGSLMVACGPRGERTLERKYAAGLENGLDNFCLITGDEARRREPTLSARVSAALYSADTATLNPWTFGFAAADNAAVNGARIFRRAKAMKIERISGGYRIACSGGAVFYARAVINAAGIFSDLVHELVAPPAFRIIPERADFLVLDTRAGDFVRHIIFCESEEKGKDVSVVPTIDGNLLLGASKEDAGGDRETNATTESGLAQLCRSAEEFLPGIPLDLKIRSFAGLRPNPQYANFDHTNQTTQKSQSADAQTDEHKSTPNHTDAQKSNLHHADDIHDFLIEETPALPRFISFFGVKTPGLSCADEIGRYAAELAANALGVTAQNPDFDPRRKSLRNNANDVSSANALGGRIVCRCRKITEREVRDAITVHGSVTIDGVKRRAGTCMGRCQGGYCTRRIIEILAEELKISPSAVLADQEGSWLVRE